MAIATAGGAVAVLQKGSASGSFANDDAVGNWAGRSVYLANNLDLNTLAQDDVSGTFTAMDAAVQSNDLAFGIEADDCPGTDTLTFDIYASYDSDFLVVGFAGGEANSSCFVDDDCGLVVLERQ